MSTLNFFDQALWAYPDFIRLGYGQCTGCHYEPQGGHLPTVYGRTVVYEELHHDYSGLKKYVPAYPLAGYGYIPQSKNLDVYASLRILGQTIKYYQASTSNTYNLLLPMQTEVGARLKQGPLALVVAAGPRLEKSIALDKWQVRDLFLSVTGNSLGQPFQNWWLKIGQSLPSFGIKDFNHDLYTRRYLGFNATDGYQGLELSWQPGSTNWALGTWFNSNVLTSTNANWFNTRLLSFKSEILVSPRWVPGFSMIAGQLQNNKGTWLDQNILSLHLRAGPTQHWYWLTELNLLFNLVRGINKGWIAFSETGYDLGFGITPWVRTEILNGSTSLSTGDESSLDWRNTLGAKIYPGWHTELRVELLYQSSVLKALQVVDVQSQQWGLRTQLHWFL